MVAMVCRMRSGRRLFEEKKEGCRKNLVKRKNEFGYVPLFTCAKYLHWHTQKLAADGGGERYPY